MKPRPRHGDTGTCRHCGQPIEYWDGNPQHMTAHWFHSGRMYEPGAGAHPDYCNETKAEAA